MNKNLLVWCLTSGGAGHEAQCLGVLQALGIQPVVKRINPIRWYRNFAPLCPAEPHPDIQPPWPDLLIVSGRHALPYARLIKRYSKKHTFVVVLQKPGLPANWFDFIWIPLHDDKLKATNVLVTLTPPNCLTNDKLVPKAEKYTEIMHKLPRPWVTVLIGGRSRTFEFGLDDAKKLVNDLILLHQKTGCGFLISPSYRTDKKLIFFFQQKLANIPAIIWNMEGENPFLDYLSLGEFFIVTADSVNMLSEASFTGKPIYAYPIRHKKNKFKRFYQGLFDYGAMRWFDGNLEYWSYEPINSTQLIAQEIKRRFAKYQQQLEDKKYNDCNSIMSRIKSWWHRARGS